MKMTTKNTESSTSQMNVYWLLERNRCGMIDRMVVESVILNPLVGQCTAYDCIEYCSNYVHQSYRDVHWWIEWRELSRSFVQLELLSLIILRAFFLHFAHTIGRALLQKTKLNRNTVEFFLVHLLQIDCVVNEWFSMSRLFDPEMKYQSHWIILCKVKLSHFESIDSPNNEIRFSLGICHSSQIGLASIWRLYFVIWRNCSQCIPFSDLHQSLSKWFLCTNTKELICKSFNHFSVDIQTQSVDHMYIFIQSDACVSVSLIHVRSRKWKP